MTAAILTLLLGIVVILAIIAANGYFVAQEFAFMSVDRARLAARAEQGDRTARQALAITRRTTFMLSGAQVGITVTGLLVGYVAEPLVGRSLGVLLGGAGVPETVSVSVGTVAALLLATVVQMVFGELYPKNLAVANPEPLARRLAPSTTVYLTVFGWLIALFDKSANLVLRALRIEPVHDVDTTATAEDLGRIVADSRESGDLPEDLSMLIDRILDFPHQDVEHAMIPRSQVGAIAPETTVGEIRSLMAHGHTRYPVISPSDEPLGIVQLVDLLRDRPAEDTPAAAVMRPPLVLPTQMSLPDALEELGRTRNQLACVIDEYGGLAGVLSTEDLAEELVGELTDEHDEAPPSSITPEQEGVWRMDGDVHVDEVGRAVGHQLPIGDYETVAGLLIAQLGELPDPGRLVRVPLPDEPRDLVLDEPVHRALEVEVLEVTRHVPSELLVRLVETTGEPGGATDGEEQR